MAVANIGGEDADSDIESSSQTFLWLFPDTIEYPVDMDTGLDELGDIRAAACSVLHASRWARAACSVLRARPAGNVHMQRASLVVRSRRVGR